MSFKGIDGVNLSSRNSSNDLPEWMLEHRTVEYPSTVTKRKEKNWNAYNRAPKSKPTEDTTVLHKLSVSGDAPSWMTEQNRRIDKTLVHEPPTNFSGKYGERTFCNRQAVPSFRQIPDNHHSDIKMAHLKYTRKKVPVACKPGISKRVDGKINLDPKNGFNSNLETSSNTETRRTRAPAGR